LVLSNHRRRFAPRSRIYNDIIDSRSDNRHPLPSAAKSDMQHNKPAGPRRGLNREEAAAYIGIGATKFDELVAKGRMPQPRRIDARKVWDVREIDLAFDDLPLDGADNSWEDAA